MNGVVTLRTLVAPFACGPMWLRRAVVDATPIARVQRMKDIVDTMYERSCDIVREKREALERGDEALKLQVGEGKDIMNILRKLASRLVRELDADLRDSPREHGGVGEGEADRRGARRADFVSVEARPRSLVSALTPLEDVHPRRDGHDVQCDITAAAYPCHPPGGTREAQERDHRSTGWTRCVLRPTH